MLLWYWALAFEIISDKHDRQTKQNPCHILILSQINFIMLHDELPPVQHPIHCTFQKRKKKKRKNHIPIISI